MLHDSALATESDYLTRFDGLLGKVDTALNNLTVIIAVQNKHLTTAKNQNIILTQHTARLEDLEKEKEERETRTLQIHTRRAEAESLVTRAAHAEALLGKHLSTAASSTEIPTQMIANQDRITEELDISRRSNRAIIFNVEMLATCFEETGMVFTTMGWTPPRTTTEQRRGSIDKAKAFGKPRPIIVFPILVTLLIS